MPFTRVARSLVRVAVALLVQVSLAAAGPRWTEAQAREWYGRQGFLVGANFVPATAINELEMWQAETFDPKRIDLELGWAAAIGMNTMRVFLHDLAYQQDPQGFLRPRRSVPRHRRETSHPADARPVRFGVGSVPGDRPAASAAARRAQFRMGAESRQGRARRSDALAAAGDVRQSRRRPIQG